MQRRNVSRRLLGLMVIGVVLVLAHVIGWLRPVEAGVGYVGTPFTHFFGGLGSSVSRWFHVIGDAGRLGDENQKLRSQVAALQQQISQDTETKAQNDALRQQLGVGNVRADRLVTAEVVGYQPDNFRKFITIGRGTDDGIATGMAVIQQGALVGTIDTVTAHTAKVFLLTDPNFRVAGLDQDATDRPTGTIRGQIGNGLIMDKIAQTETIKPGDTVVTSGLGGDIEKGLIIGRIQTVNRQDNGVFQTAQLTSDIEFNKLEIVYVVVRPQ